VNYAVIVAGGAGTRMAGAQLPKQFVEIAGKPVIVHTIEAFLSADPETEIIIPLPAQWLDHWQQIKGKYFPGKKILSANGGETRFHSVRNSLEFTMPLSIVAVHDAVRPVVSPDFIKATFSHAASYLTAIPALPVYDSLRNREHGKTVSVDRSQFFMIQTPQCFQQEILLKSYQQEFNPDFTDDASVVEAAGFELSFTEGNKFNIKITTNEDLRLAECLLKSD
jgi:2-C-methyl-D-erythritol 4-phosphate cytidylyltransferase